MTRVVPYARYSTDMQREASIEDQIRICRLRAEREDGWDIVNCYTDHAVSGASMIQRPGVQQMMLDAADGKFDVVLAESLDRLSRDQEDTAAIYKRLQFAGVKIITIAEGEITELHVGLKGSMNALFLKDLARKTHRGQRGRVENGKSGGGHCYGFDVVKETDSKGEPVRGGRTINRREAEIIRRIFREYQAGISPRAIAHALNREGVPGPRGKQWGPSTIHGNRRRGTGILNNELYVGKLVWNKLRYQKDPYTGKRVSRINPPEEWVIVDVPELRIIDDDLWEGAKAKQKELDEAGPVSGKKQRPKHLLSHLIKCSECGGGFALVSATHYGCSTARNKGTCSNKLTMRRDSLEAKVISVLRDNLMDEALCEEFCAEYTRRMNQLRMEHNAALNGYQAELSRLERDRQKLIQSIKDGVPGTVLKDEAVRIEKRGAELKDLIENADEAPPLLHPSMAKRYRDEVTQLVGALNDPVHRAEAVALIRKLIDKIVLAPNVARTDLVIDLQGDLAGILTIATKREKPLDTKGSRAQEKLVAGMRNTLAHYAQDKLVAGVGFEPTTFRL